MPYIKKEVREALTNGANPSNSGELNYKITKLLIQYIEDNELKYQTINDIMGALEGAKLEFYSKVARPYEDRKCLENGEIYDV